VSYSSSGKRFHSAGTSRMSVAVIVELARVTKLGESVMGKY
jgi:hypothetical protein